MLIITLKRTVLLTALLLFACPVHTFALDESNEVLVEHLRPALNHLLDLTNRQNPSDLDTSRIETVLDFVESAKNSEKTYTMGSRNGGSSAYHEFVIKRSLRDVLALAYSDKIPSHVTTPSSVRRSHWVKVNGKQQPFPNLAEALNDLSSPITITGIEFIENTPDTNSGAYYAYQLDRALVLMQYKGRPLMFSVSNQNEKSSVGKKGLVLGSDDHWNYIYTGEKGCTKKGLGWANSYMYNSSSVVVYYQTDDPVPQVKCGTFKWLKAGWAGINLVQPFHLRNGIERFAKTYTEILESPALKDVAKLGSVFSQIEMLTADDLRENCQRYFDHLAQQYKNDDKLAGKWLKTISKDRSFVEKMSNEEMQALVSVEFLKFLLGKDQSIDMGYLLPSKTLAQRQ